MPERKRPSRPAAPPCTVCEHRDGDLCRELLASHGGGQPLVPAKITIRRGETLFCEGDRAHYAYVVARGVLMSYKLMADGRRMVTDFHYPGDTLGENCPETHVDSADAITNAAICLYSHEGVLGLVERRPGLGQRLLRRAHRRLSAAREQMLALTNMTARQKVAHFLVRMSRSAMDRGQCPGQIWLPLSRSVIGDHLGLSMETVSRTLTQFRREGLILIDADTIELRDIEALGALAGFAGSSVRQRAAVAVNAR